MNLNKVFILGNLTRDPETKATTGGTTVCRFAVASNRMWTDKNGEKQKKAEFHNIVAWGKLGDICAQYLQKGRLVFIEGRIETRNYVAADGVKKYWTEIIAEGMQMGPRGAVQDTPQAEGTVSAEGAERGRSGKTEAELEGVPLEAEKQDEGELEVKDLPF